MVVREKNLLPHYLHPVQRLLKDKAEEGDLLSSEPTELRISHSKTLHHITVSSNSLL